MLEHKLPIGHLYPFRERKGQRSLRSDPLKLKKEKDLCKECTRTTLEKSVDRQSSEDLKSNVRSAGGLILSPKAQKR
jgi:hypothetical protein